jgi:hypothetical protein
MLWRVSYREGIILNSETFPVFEDAWAYAQLFPEAHPSYECWKYVTKKDAKLLFKKNNRLTVAWIPDTDTEIVIQLF